MVGIISDQVPFSLWVPQGRIPFPRIPQGRSTINFCMNYFNLITFINSILNPNRRHLFTTPCFLVYCLQTFLIYWVYAMTRLKQIGISIIFISICRVLTSFALSLSSAILSNFYSFILDAFFVFCYNAMIGIFNMFWIS